MSRDEIAKNNDIGAGTVTAIIKDAKQKDIPDLDLLREVAIVLKNYDFDCLQLQILSDNVMRRVTDMNKADILVGRTKAISAKHYVMYELDKRTHCYMQA